MILHLRGSAAKNQKYAEKYAFHEDHLEGIINPKFQLSMISGWKDIADFKTDKIQANILQIRI